MPDPVAPRATAASALESARPYPTPSNRSLATGPETDEWQPSTSSTLPAISPGAASFEGEEAPDEWQLSISSTLRAILTGAGPTASGAGPDEWQPSISSTLPAGFPDSLEDLDPSGFADPADLLEVLECLAHGGTAWLLPCGEHYQLLVWTPPVTTSAETNGNNELREL